MGLRRQRKEREYLKSILILEWNMDFFSIKGSLINSKWIFFLIDETVKFNVNVLEPDINKVHQN